MKNKKGMKEPHEKTRKENTIQNHNKIKIKQRKKTLQKQKHVTITTKKRNTKNTKNDDKRTHEGKRMKEKVYLLLV